MKMLKKEQQLVRKGLLVGVGIVAYAQEKTKKFVNELVKKENLSREEGKKMVRVIYREADQSWKKIASLVENELKKLVVSKKAVKSKAKKKKR